MAISGLPGIGFTLTIPNTTTLVAVDAVAFGASAEAVPDNCRSIVVYNMATANRIFVKFMPVPGILASITLLASTVIPGLSSMTFDIGFIMDRGGIGATSAINLYFMAETGLNVPVNVTYLMGRGSNIP